MRRFVKFGLALAILSVLFLLTVTACQTESQEEETPLIIGNLNAFTGSLAEFGAPLRNAIELASEHVNRAGGVNGQSVLIVSRDTAVNPVQGVDAAGALVNIERAVAIVGALSSGVTVAAANAVTIPQETILISGASTAPSITVLEDNDFVFRTTPSDASQGVVLARLAREQGFNRIGIMYLNNAYGEGLADQFEESFTALGGTVTAKVPHEDVQPTYASELTKATAGGIDALAALSYTGQAAVYVQEALEGSYANRFLLADGTKGSEWIDEINAWTALEGTMGTAQGSPGSPAKDAFETSYVETYGVEAPIPLWRNTTTPRFSSPSPLPRPERTPTPRRSVTHCGTWPTSRARSLVPGRAEIARALEMIANGEDINYNGAGGDIEFDENGDVVGTIEIWTISGGEIKSTGRFELP